MRKVFHALRRAFNAWLDSTATRPTMKRRPVDEILDVGYAHAHAPHSVEPITQAKKDAA